MNHKKGDKVTGQIKSITDFGVFIGLAGGIDGLVHLSDLSWTAARRGSGAQVQEGRRGRGGGARRSTSSASAFRSASSSSKAIRSPTTWPAHDKGGVVERQGQVGRRQGRGGRARRRCRRLPARLRGRARPGRGHPHAPEGRRCGHGDDHQHRPQEPLDQPLDQGQGRTPKRARRCRSIKADTARTTPGTTNLGALLQRQARTT